MSTMHQARIVFLLLVSILRTAAVGQAACLLAPGRPGTARRMLTLAPAPICQSPTGVKALWHSTWALGCGARGTRALAAWRAAGAAACLRAHAFPLVH